MPQFIVDRNKTEMSEERALTHLIYSDEIPENVSTVRWIGMVLSIINRYGHTDHTKSALQKAKS